ncbi:uncharacterized protein LOC106074578 [Biomphalaria glabrata]|uniref:Uncharacterized protein LOC106074578 n=1 Tax=Biomphalaria glabrata TaxID=6526 RepID=A0A2C9JZV2_BIOGL|nr:uncharacterized protein LOC106074578 [Biomphalaria glabrata]
MTRWLTTILVVGYMLPVVSSQGSAGHLVYSAEPSGVHCGTNQCTREASCRSHTYCDCPSGKYGDGSLKCYPSNSRRAEVLGNTSTLTSFSEAIDKIVWPGSYSFSEFTCTRHSNGRDCRAQIIGINTIRNGRTIAYGFRINFRCPHDPHLSEEGVCLMVTGVQRGGKYYYREWGLVDCGPEVFLTETDPNNYPDLTLDGSGSGDGNGDEGSTGGGGGGNGGNGGSSGGGGGSSGDEEDSSGEDELPWEDPSAFDIGGGHLVQIEVDEDNTAVVSVPDCGFEVGFRAFDLEAVDDPQQSVLYLYVSDDVDFIYPNRSLAGSRSLEEHYETDLVGENLLLYQALTYTPKQLSDHLGKLCSTTAKVFQASCDSVEEKESAVVNCTFLLSNEVVQCLDAGTAEGTKSVHAFQLCIQIVCSPRPSWCSLFRSAIPEHCWDTVASGYSNLDCT